MAKQCIVLSFSFKCLSLSLSSVYLPLTSICLSESSASLSLFLKHLNRFLELAPPGFLSTQVSLYKPHSSVALFTRYLQKWGKATVPSHTFFVITNVCSAALQRNNTNRLWSLVNYCGYRGRQLRISHVHSCRIMCTQSLV